MAVEASIVVSFGTGVTSDTVVVEFDPIHSNNLDADGKLKTTFDADTPDRPVILLHYGDSLAVSHIVLTEGSISEIGSSITQSRTNDGTYAAVGDTSSISYVNASLLGQPSWIGNGSGTIKVSGTYLKLVSGGPCAGVASFNVTFQKRYMITPPSNMVLDEDGNYQITVFIFMEAA